MCPRYEKEVTIFNIFPPIVILCALPAFLESMYMTLDFNGIIPLHHFTSVTERAKACARKWEKLRRLYNTIIIFDTVLRQTGNIEHEK